jgi:hypothetical protein
VCRAAPRPERLPRRPPDASGNPRVANLADVIRRRTTTPEKRRNPGPPSRGRPAAPTQPTPEADLGRPRRPQRPEKAVAHVSPRARQAVAHIKARTEYLPGDLTKSGHSRCSARRADGGPWPAHSDRAHRTRTRVARRTNEPRTTHDDQRSGDDHFHDDHRHRLARQQKLIEPLQEIHFVERGPSPPTTVCSGPTRR